MSNSLYHRLGETQGIKALVDDIIAAHSVNPAIKARFLPYQADPHRLAELKQLLCDFLQTGSGGPQSYQGRAMPEAHRGMNISETEYMATIDDILETLDRHGVDDRSRNEVLAIVYSLKDQIVHL